MTTLRAFRCEDLFKINQINLDPLTETYGLPFYLNYLALWPEYFKVQQSPSGKLIGYIMGKSEARSVLYYPSTLVPLPLSLPFLSSSPLLPALLPSNLCLPFPFPYILYSSLLSFPLLSPIPQSISTTDMVFPLTGTVM